MYIREGKNGILYRCVVGYKNTMSWITGFTFLFFLGRVRLENIVICACTVIATFRWICWCFFLVFVLTISFYLWIFKIGTNIQKTIWINLYYKGGCVCVCVRFYLGLCFGENVCLLCYVRPYTRIYLYYRDLYEWDFICIRL